MKILVITNNFPSKRLPTSGIFLKNFLVEFSKHIDELIIINPRPFFPKIFVKLNQSLKKWHIDPLISTYKNIKIIRPYIPFIPNPEFHHINAFLLFISLYPLIANLKDNFNFFIGHNILPEAVASVMLGQRFHIPVIPWAIGTDINSFSTLNYFNQFITTRYLQKNNIILATSHNLSTVIQGLIKSQNTVQTFYRGIDLTRFCRTSDKANLSDLKCSLGLNVNREYIIFVGRIIKTKGIFDLAEAFLEIAPEFPEYDLLLIGEETEKSELNHIFEQSGLIDRVVFSGIQPHKSIAKYLSVSSLMVFPSWSEGMPNALLEALAIGLPVISTDVGGIPEIIQNEKTGLLVKLFDKTQLVNQIKRMLTDTKLRNQCVANGKSLILNKFDVKKNAIQFLKLLENYERKNMSYINSASGDRRANS